MYKSRSHRILTKCRTETERSYPLFKPDNDQALSLTFKESQSDQNFYKTQNNKHSFPEILENIFDDLSIPPLATTRFSPPFQVIDREATILKSTSGSSSRSTSSSGYGSASGSTPRSLYSASPDDVRYRSPSPPTGSKRTQNILDYKEKGLSRCINHKVAMSQSKKRKTDKSLVDSIINNKKTRSTPTVGLKPNSKPVPKLSYIAGKAVKKNFLGPGYVASYVLPVIDKLKTILSRFSTSDLREAEVKTPHLWRYTEEHWKEHCKRKFKGRKPRSGESWREVFIRCKKEREQRKK